MLTHNRLFNFFKKKIKNEKRNITFNNLHSYLIESDNNGKCSQMLFVNQLDYISYHELGYEQTKIKSKLRIVEDILTDIKNIIRSSLL